MSRVGEVATQKEKGEEQVESGASSRFALFDMPQQKQKSNPGVMPQESPELKQKNFALVPRDGGKRRDYLAASARVDAYGPPEPSVMRTFGDAVERVEPTEAAETRPKERSQNREDWFISQFGDRKYRGYLFMCGSTSLYMACRDFEAPGSKDLTGGGGFSDRPSENERVALARKTGVMTSGMFPGGPDLMAAKAREQGLAATAYDRNSGANSSKALSMDVMDRELLMGHGVILNAPRHFVYIKGKTEDGNYVVGDPANPNIKVMTRADVQSRLVSSGRGFTAVWNPGIAFSNSASSDAGGSPAPLVLEEGNGSMFEGSSLDGSGTRSIPRMGDILPVPQDMSSSSVGHRSPDEEAFHRNNPDFDSEMPSRIVSALYNPERQPRLENTDRGIRVGIRQFDQQNGLPDFLESLWKENPELFKKLFPHLYKLLAGQGMDFRAISEMKFTEYGQMTQLGEELQKAFRSKELRQFEIDDVRSVAFHGSAMAQKAGIKSDYGVSYLTDAVNQIGREPVAKALQDPKLKTLLGVSKEREAIERFKFVLSNPNYGVEDADGEQVGFGGSHLPHLSIA
jgi:hypothetical protein